MRFMSKLSLLLFFPLVFSACGAKQEAPDLLKRMQIEVHSVFTEVETELKSVVHKLSSLEAKSEASRNVLNSLISKFDYVEGCVIVDSAGNVVAFEPKENNQYEGQNISSQKHMVKFYENKKPLLSNVFKLIEGGYGAVVVRPLFAKDKSLIGSVNVVIRPQLFLRSIFKPIVEGFPVDAWIMDLEGNIVYDPDEQEIGRNIFSDPIYADFDELKSVAKQMQEQKDGIGIYRYYSNGTNQTVTKQMYWTTVQMYGTPWRVVMTKVLTESSNIVRDRLGATSIVSLEEKIEDFVNNKQLIGALHLEESEQANVKKLSLAVDSFYDIGSLKELFANFYKANPGIYYLAWIDPAGVARFAFPRENSLDVYDFHKNRTSSDRLFLNVVETQKKATFNISLAEGGEASIIAMPVFKAKQFLGVIYVAKKLVK